MAIRKLVAVAPVIAALALAGPVASANAAPVPCYPYPAFCGVNGQQLLPVPWFWPMSPTPAPQLPFHFPLPFP